jgi:hypothetical protein
MWRAIGAIIAGLVAWAVIVTVINLGLRATLPGYHAAEATLQFSLTMKVARLLMAAVTSVGAGAIVGRVASDHEWAPWVVGLIILAMFVPAHVQLWNKFPAWYHLAFLVPLAPLVALGGWLGTRTRDGTPDLRV